jgi:hypothetical protein
MSLEELEKQVQLAEDIQEIEHLQRMYGYYFDTQQWQKIVDLFSDNAESVEIVDHGVLYGKKGVEKIYLQTIGAMDRGPRQPWVAFIVMQIGAVIDVAPDGKSAKGRWQTWLCESKPYGAFPRQEWLHGYYENKYVKEDGRWKFSLLHWNNTFCSPVEDGWLTLPLMGWMPLPDADAPPTAFHPYPDFLNNVPYHYKHPVTGK